MGKKDREIAEAWQQFQDNNEADLMFLNLDKDYNEYYFHTKDSANNEKYIGITQMEQPMVPTQVGLSETNILNFLSEFKRQYLEQIVDSFEKAEKKELKYNKNKKNYLEREINNFDQQNKEEIPQKNRKIRREMSLEKDSDRRKEIKILRNKIFDSSGEEKFMFQEKLKNLINKMESWTPKNKYQDRKKGGNREQFKSQQSVRQEKIHEVEILIEQLVEQLENGDKFSEKKLKKLNRKLARLEGKQRNSHLKRKKERVLNVIGYTKNK